MNGVDDDGDGLIDLNDTLDCSCISGVQGPGLIPNPSFEQYSCLPTIYNYPPFNTMTCVPGWSQATTPTCDFLHDLSYYPAVFPHPVPDGNGLVGGYMMPGWREYPGTCLTGLMPVNQPQTITFDIAGVAVDGEFLESTPVNYGQVAVTIYGRSNCVTFPLNTVECPVSMGWSVLGSAIYQPNGEWSTLSISFVPPFNVATIMIGAPCVLPPEYVQGEFSPYFLYDNFREGADWAYMASVDEVADAVIDTIAGTCAPVHMLIADPATTIGTYQWFHDGIALIGQTDTILDLAGNDLGPGLYEFHHQVNGTTCAVTPIDPQFPEHPSPQFTAIENEGCAPLEVSFANTTPTTLPMTCLWDLAGLGSSGACDTTVIYADPGSYDVTLTITYPQACPLDTTVIGAVNVFEVMVPEIIEAEGQLCAQPTGNNTQWYLNGTPIDTTACITAYDPGQYTVFVDYGLPCQELSVAYFTTGLTNAGNGSGWMLSWLGDELLVRFPKMPAADATWSMVDMTGRTLVHGNSGGQDLLKIDVSDHASGAYFLLLNDGGDGAGTVIRFAIMR